MVSNEVSAPFIFSSISISEILSSGGRLEANVFNIEARQARDLIEKSCWPRYPLAGNAGLSTAYHRPRFKRPYVDKAGIPFYQPSQISDINPAPARYISQTFENSIAPLKVKKGQLLLTCSGTIGQVCIVGETLHDAVFSHDLIRMDAKDKVGVGYLYAFMKSETGNKLLTTGNYGAVIQHIEPEYLSEIMVPLPSEEIRQKINNLMMESFSLRDESNILIKQAQSLLLETLGLPNFEELSYEDELRSNIIYDVPSNSFNGRFDATYHSPIASKIEQLLYSIAPELTTVSDARVSKRIILPGQFKRVYVKKGYGVVFFSGKDIGELDPSDKKYLASSIHGDRIKKLRIHENMVLVTCSGTVGNTTIVPKHWDGWTMTHDIIRVEPNNKYMAGYLYAWLSTSYGQSLLKKCSYGAVVQHIEDHHLEEVLVPLLDNSKIIEIGETILLANEKRFEAYRKEHEGLEHFNRYVLNIG